MTAELAHEDDVAQRDLTNMRHRDRALIENYEWLTQVVGLEVDAAARRLGYSRDSLARRINRYREESEGAR